MNTPKTRRLPRVALALLAVVALFALTLATPQGRSFAQEILQFFNRTEETSFPLAPSQMAPNPEQDTANQPTAEPPSPLVTVAEAEAQAGFDAAELSAVPEGLTFLGARLYGNTIHLEYETPDQGGHLTIAQSQEGYNQSDWDSVPADNIVPVKIGELDGEFVQGTFVVFPNATEATWNAEAPLLRLRWQKDGIWYEITKFGDTQPIETLDQAALIALAEDLMSQ